MAGWTDIEVEDQVLGEFESGYILDIKLINTYIKAHNEKANIVNVPKLDPIITEIEIPEEDRDEPTEEVPIPPTTEDAGPYFWNFLKLSSLLQGYGRLMNNVIWVKKSVFDDPLSIDSVTSTPAGKFTEDDIITIIGQQNFDILSDPFDNWTLKELQSVEVFNAMYQLYSQVFVYVERRSIPTSRYFISYHAIKAGESATPYFRRFIPRTDDGEFFKVEDFLDTSLKNSYENFEFSVEVDNLRHLNFSIQDSQFGEINTGDANDPNDTDDRYTSSGSFSQRKFNSVLHQFKNDEGDFVILGFSCAGYVENNHIRDYTLPTETMLETYGILDEDFPQVIAVQRNYTRIKWPDMPVSEITEDGWNMETILNERHDYALKTTDFIYSFDDILPKPSNPNDTRKSIKRSISFALYTGTSPIDGTRQDFYYDTNVEAMIYNTLEDEEEA